MAEKRDKMKYKIALAQINSDADIAGNMKKIEKMIQEAANGGAELIAFPENSEYIGTDYPGNAQTVPGAVTDAFAGWAKKYRIYIHCGSITQKREAGTPYNTSFLWNKEGKEIGRYSKLHMFDISIDDGPSYKESDETSAGNEIVVSRTKLGCFGFAICYDMRFPEIFKLMAKAGAELIFVPADFTMNTGKDHWMPLLRSRAIENTCYIAAPGQIGQKPEFAAYGKSMVIDPWGNVIAMASDEEQVIFAEIDTDLIQKVRRQVPSLQNVRTDIYTLTSDHVKVYKEEA